jgi:hypothetical protein
VPRDLDKIDCNGENLGYIFSIVWSARYAVDIHSIGVLFAASYCKIHIDSFRQKSMGLLQEFLGII